MLGRRKNNQPQQFEYKTVEYKNAKAMNKGNNNLAKDGWIAQPHTVKNDTNTVLFFNRNIQTFVVTYYRTV